MRKLKVVLMPLLLIPMLLASLAMVQAAPPGLPSSFYGDVNFVTGDNGPTAGDFVDAYVPGADSYVARAEITSHESGLVYSIKVPEDDPLTTDVKEGGLEGDLVTFKIGARIVATGIWHSGTYVTLNFHPPKANPGGPYSGTVGEEIQLGGSAEDLGLDASAYAWDLTNNGEYTDSSLQNPKMVLDSAGTKTIGLKVTDSQGGEGFASTMVEVAKATAEVTLSDLTHTYDGTPKGAAATTDPAGLQVTFTYDGDAVEPTDAGTYTVVATVVDDNYQGSAEDTLVIDPASASITLSDLDQDYDGDPKPVTVTTDPPDVVAYSVTYDGTSTVPSTTGAYAVAATITDPNYTGDPASNTLVIRATHNISLEPGWNLVSFNLQPYPSNAPGDVLESLKGMYDLVYAWDAAGGHAESGHWMSFDDIPETTDTIIELNEGMGFWIHITDPESQTLSVKGFISDQTAISLLTGSGGWNLVGFPSSAASTPSGAFTSVGSSLSMVYEYDPSDQASPWNIYDPDAPAYANDLETLRPGYGYWVLVDQETTWDVHY